MKAWLHVQLGEPNDAEDALIRVPIVFPSSCHRNVNKLGQKVMSENIPVNVM